MFQSPYYVNIMNVDGTHQFNLNDVTSPMSQFDVAPDDRSDAKRYKPQAAGSWPTRSFDGTMTISMQGVLFNSDSASCVTLRKSLMLALKGLPGIDVTAYKRGTISFQPNGESELWKADFGPMTVSAPVRGSYPAFIEYLITVETFTPYFYGGTTPSNLYYWN